MPFNEPDAARPGLSRQDLVPQNSKTYGNSD